MYAVPYPAVLAPDWVPPVLPDRSSELAQLARWLGDPRPPSRPPWVASVIGPVDSGTSALARLAGRRLLEAIRREDPDRNPVLVRVSVGIQPGSLGVASALLRGLDSGFEPRGFPVAEVTAGFVRRLQREDRPAVVVLDDIGPDSADLSVIVRGLLSPERFLPEGVTRPPEIWTILAGQPEAARTWARLFRSGVPRSSQIVLGPPTPESIRSATVDRAARALGRPAPAGLVESIVARTLLEGRGPGRALELLRRELLGFSSAPPSPTSASAGNPALRVEPRVLAALERATRGGTATLGEIRSWEVRLAEKEGRRPLPATTLWRRMVRLQAAGVIRREVRAGGPGGTRCTISVVGRLPFYALSTTDRTRRGDAASPSEPPAAAAARVAA